MKYKITPIIAGYFGPVGDDTYFLNGDPNNICMMPSIIFHLQSETESIMVDASFSYPDRCVVAMNRIMALDVRRTCHLSLLIQKYGIDPFKVTKVILTHCHWDHAGGTYAFPNAKIYVQKTDWDYFMADETLQPEFREELLSMKRRLILVDGVDKSIEGIEMIPVGGHSIGSQILYVDTEDGKAVLAGDLVMHPRNIKEYLPIGIYCYDQKECKEALEQIIQTGYKVYYSHVEKQD